MTNLRKLRSLVAVGATLGALLGFAGHAAAVDNVPNCNPVAAPNGGICNGNCKLGTDVVCQPGQQIVLNNGADLDMDIYDLSCASGQDCTTAAVKMNAANSIVKHTGSSEARILGSWTAGVACGGFTGSRVTGIRIDGKFTTAVGGCSKVDGNVIIGASGSQVAVSNGGISDADWIMDNYFDGPWENRTVSVTGTLGTHEIAIDRNLFVTRVVPGTQGYPIVVNPNIPATISNNIFMGDGTQTLIAAISPSAVEYSNNICDPTMGATCSDAIAVGECAAPTAEFSIP